MLVVIDHRQYSRRPRHQSVQQQTRRESAHGDDTQINARRTPSQHSPHGGKRRGVSGRTGDQEGEGRAGRYTHVYERRGYWHRAGGTDVQWYADRHHHQDRER